jgi:hypothetical protein
MHEGWITMLRLRMHESSAASYILMACHLCMGTSLPFNINPLMPELSVHLLSKIPWNTFHFLGRLMWCSVFSASHCASIKIFQHQRLKCIVISNHSDQSSFLITEPKETAVDISSSGISARITVQKRSFGGRSKGASSRHAALTFHIRISWYTFLIALCRTWSD